MTAALPVPTNASPGSPSFPSPQARPLVDRRSWRTAFMKVVMQLPPIRQIVERMNLLIGAPVFFASLRTACQLNLFGLLKQRPGLTMPEIATALRIQEYPARVLLLTCVTLRLLKKRGDRFYCPRLSASLFDPASPKSAVPYIEWVHHITYRSMFHYAEAVREARAAGLQVFGGTEDNLYGRIAHDPMLEETFHNAMAKRSHESNGALVQCVRFSEFPRVLDVGGGSGENLSTIARSHANVRGTLLDFPSVAERARQRFAQEGFQDRLEAEGRNFLQEEFPTGYSCVLMAHLTPIFSEATNRDLLRKAFAALVPGGLLCICAPFVDDDESGPLSSAILSPYFLCTVNGQGRHYSVKEVTAWVRESGFAELQGCALTPSDRVLVAIKPR